MRTIGIVAHSTEGSALCYVTACRYAATRMGPFNHPTIVMSAIPMAASMPGWNSGRHAEVAEHLVKGVELVAAAGADFYVCPDNTAHIVLEQVATTLPIPGLHIAEVVAAEIKAKGWKRAAVLGTKWTMTGPVYAAALGRRSIEPVVPDAGMRTKIHDVIFGQLCRGEFTDEARALFQRAIHELKERGADCVILGCTEIPLVVDEASSPLPTLDSTRLLARYAVDAAMKDGPLAPSAWWIRP